MHGITCAPSWAITQKIQILNWDADGSVSVLLVSTISSNFLHRLPFQLAVESLPDAPVTEVRPEEKMKAPADTEAASEDIDEVIELPDVPTKVPERPEAPEKTKGSDLMLLSPTILSSVCFLSIRCIFFVLCADDIFCINSFGRAATCIVDGAEINRALSVCSCNIPIISLYYPILSHLRILFCTAWKKNCCSRLLIIARLDFSVSIYSPILPGNT